MNVELNTMPSFSAMNFSAWLKPVCLAITTLDANNEWSTNFDCYKILTIDSQCPVWIHLFCSFSQDFDDPTITQIV